MLVQVFDRLFQRQMWQLRLLLMKSIIAPGSSIYRPGWSGHEDQAAWFHGQLLEDGWQVEAVDGRNRGHDDTDGGRQALALAVDVYAEAADIGYAVGESTSPFSSRISFVSR